ncbi:beta-ketoacyl-[acyl-carrier-protein] synthase family protein [Christiangramia sabulilitoris]|uniref:Beta-ketoacyl-[acyl-carrier-protein] synthase family protein n=1 Tax=Christiangramia sabulilitoris TaxID=2583991 RepID=A0A550I615_9FLAO|nr:beta-ketoacyl-[acyl-carrier-protein] synthase family protein [Christiangramia sabulilitoris]TRO66419.1 beta-ketoacyl-[acyl-carrier-protein] synthase family protein [Christiangramia sabulilitoris]
MKGVAVTGMGIISSIGRNLDDTLFSLQNAKDGISKPEILITRHKNTPVGEIKMTNSDLSEILNLPPDNNYTRAALLAVFAINELLRKSNFIHFPEDTALISGTSIGGMDKTEEHYFDFQEKKEVRKYIQAQHPGFTTENVAAYFGLGGKVTTLSTACSSSANAIMMGARLIASGKLKRVIVGGSDCLTRFTLNGFHSLKILSQTKNRPFDDDRDGLNLGEAAGYLLLEADDCLNGKKIMGRICGYGNANDAYHQTASSENGEGAYRVIMAALKKADLSPSDISYVNAHGTGTNNNDLSESVALTRIFGDNVPPFSSTKGFTGHTLGAAGAIEAIFSLLSLQNDEIYPNLNFQNHMLETGLKPVQVLRKQKVDTVLSNSFGFGGNCTSLIFRKND